LKLLYNIAIKSYGLGIISSSILGNKKANDWINGRRNCLEKIKNDLNNESPIWLHVSSLGEYIMAKPLISKLLIEFPEKNILLTFFSPSGYNNVKLNQERVNKHYLPLDTPSNAKEFIKVVNPCIAVFAKYDFWFNYLIELQKSNIQTLFFSTNLNSNQLYFRKGWNWQKSILKKISKILVINQKIDSFLKKENFANTTVCGDTRFDEVRNKKKLDQDIILKYIDNRVCLVLGSSWEAEEKILKKALLKLNNIAIIIAPHDPSVKRINSLEKRFRNKTLKLSQLKEGNLNRKKILIVDSIGVLSKIYQHSDISFIGGGFKNKLHNILEPAATNNVILFGYNHSKYMEANELIKINGAIKIASAFDLVETINKLAAIKVLERYKKTALDYVENNKGATEIILKEIVNLIPHSTTSASSKI
jgi:3-deoxy-D-manno-octulosonic-acid transferase